MTKPLEAVAIMIVATLDQRQTSGDVITDLQCPYTKEGGVDELKVCLCFKIIVAFFKLNYDIYGRQTHLLM